MDFSVAFLCGWASDVVRKYSIASFLQGPLLLSAASGTPAGRDAEYLKNGYFPLNQRVIRQISRYWLAPAIFTLPHPLTPLKTET
jgi:hypothetical protein